jgi:hypothetical protein
MEYFLDTQVTMLTYTALGLTYTMRLQKPPLGIPGVEAFVQIDHSTEEQRAFIGLYCLVSLYVTVAVLGWLSALTKSQQFFLLWQVESTRRAVRHPLLR